MKLFNYTLLIILLSSSCFATEEPNTFNKKDLIEKVDRSELESIEKTDKDKANVVIPKFEIPSIEFEKGSLPNKSSRVANDNSKVVTTKKASNPAQEAQPATTIPATTIPATNKPSKTLIFADSPITLKEIIVKDKIVVNKGKILVYRNLQSNIIEYRYFGKLPLTSLGLESSQPNNYTVVNKSTLINDFNVMVSSQAADSVKETVNSSQAKTKTEPNKTDLSTDLNFLTQQVEQKYNKGRPIKKSLTFENLRVDDNIIIMNNLQIVQRGNSHGNKFFNYWLSEKLDTNNPIIEKVSDYKYRVIK